MRLFIADDSEILRNHLSNIIADIYGIEIIGEAANASDAIEAIRNLSPEVAIIDIKLPGKSGIHLLQQIKAFKPEIIVIIFTDYPYPQYRRKCDESGADYFFEKSSESEKLIEVLKKLKTNSRC